MGHGKGMNKMQPNKSIHADPKSLAALGPGDARCSPTEKKVTK
jgi:hypothetical protein